MTDVDDLSASLALGPKGSPTLEAVLNKIAALTFWRSKIEIALHHGADSHSFDDICKMVLSERLAMFVYPESFLIMEVITFPQYKVFHCFLAGGDMKSVLDSEEKMAILGKELGCKYLSFAGRDGWTRVHKNNGWMPICSTLYKEIV